MIDHSDVTGDPNFPVARTIGQRVRELRAQQHLSQRDLADRSGLSPSVISLIERGQRMPSIRTIRKLATALDCSLVELLSLERRADAPPDPSRR